MDQETTAPRGESPPDRCAVTLSDGAGSHSLPTLEGCWRTDQVELRGRTVLVSSRADLRDCATCTEGLLRALDLGDPAAGWKVLAAHTEHPYETRGVVSAIAMRDGAIGLSGGPSVGVRADDPRQPVTLRHWTVASAGATAPAADPPALLPPRLTVDWQQVVSTGRELLALTVDRARRRTVVARVPLDLGAMKDADAPLSALQPGDGIQVLAQQRRRSGRLGFAPFRSIAAGYRFVAWERLTPDRRDPDELDAIVSVRNTDGRITEQSAETAEQLRIERLLSSTGHPEVLPLYLECLHER